MSYASMTYMYEEMKTQMVPKPKTVDAMMGDQIEIELYLFIMLVLF